MPQPDLGTGWYSFHFNRRDAARQRLGLASRTDLFRRALQLYLKKAGETEVAALFAAPAEA